MKRFSNILLIADEEIAVEAKVLVGKPFIEIIRQVLANDHNLVIKCAEGAASQRHMPFGSTDMHLMCKCPCPVWIIKSTDHQQYRRILAAALTFSSTIIIVKLVSDKREIDALHGRPRLMNSAVRTTSATWQMRCA